MSLSIPEITIEVAADLAARGVTAEVVFGSWKKEYHNGGNRIVIGLGDYEYEPPGPANAPGVQVIDENTAARSLMTRAQYAEVVIHAAPVGDEKDPERQTNTHKAACVLLHKTLAAMYRVAHGSFGWGNGKWPEPERAEFVYGAVTTFRAQFAVPILDDAFQRVTVDVEGSTTTTKASFPSGDYVAAQSP